MGVHIDIAGQASMDLYYTNYKSGSDFFELEDFIAHCAGVLGDIYMKGMLAQKAEFRQDKKDEIPSFDPNTLGSQVLEVIHKDGQLYATLTAPLMSFPYDEQGIGLQDIYATKPYEGVKFERTTRSSKYQLDYVPTCDVVFFYLDINVIRFVNKSLCNLKEVNVLYVPSITDPDLLVPDGVYEYVITTAAMTIKESGKNTVVKKTADQNPNKLIQTETNLQ